jgi:hypothetical protein
MFLLECRVRVIINVIATASSEWLDGFGNQACSLFIIHLAKQKNAVVWDTYISEFLTGSRMENGLNRMIGN